MRSFANSLQSFAFPALVGATGLFLAVGAVAEGRSSGAPSSGAAAAPRPRTEPNAGPAGANAGPAGANAGESFGPRLSPEGAVSESKQPPKTSAASGGDLEALPPEKAPERGSSALANGKKDSNPGAPLNIPLIEGSPGLLLRIPELDASGRLRSLFVIGEVSKVDDRTVEIRDSFFETYKDDLSKDFSISLPKATLDLYSRVLLAKVPVTIWRTEFELRGATMEFDTSTREGGLGGPIEMIIYNGFGGAEETKPASKNKPSAAKGKAPR